MVTHQLKSTKGETSQGMKGKWAKEQETLTNWRMQRQGNSGHRKKASEGTHILENTERDKLGQGKKRGGKGHSRS
jgi:hypothetical protein